MATNSLNKINAAKITSLINFIESKTDFPRILILNAILDFERLYDLPALLRYFRWAQYNRESDNAILGTILHDLHGIEKDHKTFCPRSAGY